MTDLIAIRCPKCQAQLKLKDRKAVGKKVPCPKCGVHFLVQASEAEPAESDAVLEAVPDELETSGGREKNAASARNRSRTNRVDPA